MHCCSRRISRDFSVFEIHRLEPVYSLNIRTVVREVVESPRAGLLKLLLVGEGLEGAGDGVRTALLDHGFAHIILEGDVHEGEACLIDDRGFSIFFFFQTQLVLALG